MDYTFLEPVEGNVPFLVIKALGPDFTFLEPVEGNVPFLVIKALGPNSQPMAQYGTVLSLVIEVAGSCQKMPSCRSKDTNHSGKSTHRRTNPSLCLPQPLGLTFVQMSSAHVPVLFVQQVVKPKSFLLPHSLDTSDQGSLVMRESYQ